MTIQLSGGRGAVPGQTPHESHPPEADWNSPLWEQPDTVAAPWRSAPDEPPPPAAPTGPIGPTHPRRRRSRAMVAAAAVLLLVVGLAGSALVNGAFGRSSTPSEAVGPQPSLPAIPTPVPSQPSLTPPGEGQGQGNQGGSQSTTENQAAAAVSPGLVDVVSTIGYDGAQGAGTGVVLTADGIVLTNHHVVAGSTSISVTDIGDGQTYEAKVLGYDRSHDVAVLQLSGASGLQTAPLGDSGNVSVGDSVVAIGNALGKGGAPTVVSGNVTDLDQSIAAQDSANGTSEQLSGLIEIDAPIQPGDSGGALVDSHNEVIGIITAGSDSAENSSDQTATQGYAVPMATAHSVAEQIVAGRSSSTVHIGGTGFLGLQIDGSGAGSFGGGLLVAGTVNGSAAADAGIVAGDVVTAVDGRAVATQDALKSLLDGKHPGDTVHVRWTDQTGTSQAAKVTLTDGPTG
jgi:S1-C subfamily serine protease